MHDLDNFAHETEFVFGIRENQLLEILGAAQVRQVGIGQVLVTEGAKPTHFFLLRSGRVKFYRLTPRGEEVLLANLVPGDIFGLGNLLTPPTSYIGTAETTRNSELLVWEQARIRKLAEKYPRLAQNTLNIVLKYLTGHLDRMFHLLGCTAEERLARSVLHMATETGVIVPNGVEMTATNEELAADANLSLFTVSRVLNQWARAGALKKSRGKVFIKSPEKLIRH